MKPWTMPESDDPFLKTVIGLLAEVWRVIEYDEETPVGQQMISEGFDTARLKEEAEKVEEFIRVDMSKLQKAN